MDNNELRNIIFGTLCDNQHPKGKGILVKHFTGISCLLANKISSQLEPLVMQKIAEVSEKDYEEYYNSPAVQEFMNAPGGKPQKIKLADLNYYKNIIATQNDSEILKLELQDLIKDIEEEREQR